MPRWARPSVLISEPQTFRQSRYLPYLWAVLRSHCERTADLAGRVEWPDPIYTRGTADQTLAPYRRPPDVLGLSCYTWNWDLQCRIAAEVKRRNPQCLVVAGGPHPDYKDPDFFRRHPFIDVVAIKDGELAFERILRRVLDARAAADRRPIPPPGDLGLEAIPGLYLPAPDDGRVVGTGGAEVPGAFPYSPYIDQRAYFEAFVRRSRGAQVDAIWETTRGCPYSCSFCDWGSATMSKVRPFDMQRVAAEIDWFARLGVHSLLIADANFGILPRDLQIAALLNAARAAHGFPRFVHYSPAKNHPERTFEIARAFAASGISPVHTFAVQHTNPEVLAASDRRNIPVARQRATATAVTAHAIPSVVQLILGLPGDTCDRWKTCLTDLMDWGLHDNYQIFDYALLPNAPAADPAYRQRWAIETVVRSIPREGTGQRRADDEDALTRVPIVVRSATFTRDDWVRMKVYAAFVRALHNFGLTRLVALYLHFGHGVGYREIYDALIDGYFAAGAAHHGLTRHLDRFLADEDVPGDLPLDGRAAPALRFEPSRWVFVTLGLDGDRWYREMAAFLLARYPRAASLPSALDYQWHALALPGRSGSARFETDRDWVAYFERAHRLTAYEPLGEPAPAPGAQATVVAALAETGPEDERQRWALWIEGSHEVRRVLSGVRQVRLQTGAD